MAFSLKNEVETLGGNALYAINLAVDERARNRSPDAKMVKALKR